MPIDERICSGNLLSSLSTFSIGGPARYYLEAKQISDAKEALQWARQKNIPIFILGKGSNCLFDDRGFDGLVLHNRINFCEFSPRSVHVGAGYNFTLLGVQTARRGLSGLEFASGIPGTVGGAVFMNAGANRRETCDSLSEVLYLDESGDERVFQKSDLVFSYRTSPFQKMKGCILAARFDLEELTDARKTQLEIVEYRLKTQPYKEKSAGCIFRNPSAEFSAGALIEKCGLKGAKCGGAEVSTTHANFIVNASQASSADVLSLIKIVQETVAKESGIHLETEVYKVDFS
jgi:UDP-N-acetylmuramate dehydrogenase